MFKQIILPLLGVIAFVIIVGVFTQRSSFLGLTNTLLPTPTPVPVKTLTIGSKAVSVTIADTEAKREQGLSGVKSLEVNSGMLFSFGSSKVNPLFWMKGMLIPLDMIWITDGKVVRIDKNIPIPTPNTPDNLLKTYSPGQPIDYVLEVNAGFSDTNLIKVGNSVALP